MTAMEPSELPFFAEQDFAAYEDARQKDPDYNGYRLAVRRKLGAHGKASLRALKKEAGLVLTCRTSLNHPHGSNRFRVRSQIAYLSRAPQDKKALHALVGPAIGQDVDKHYVQTTLAVQVDAGGLEVSLRIHAQAWWDGQNLKNRVTRDRAEMDLFGDLVNRLPRGFVLYMDNWRKEYVAGEIPPQELDRYFNTYTPGEHWFHLRRRIGKRAAIEHGPAVAPWIRQSFLALPDLYRFIVWSPDNNWLFGEDGRMG